VEHSTDFCQSINFFWRQETLAFVLNPPTKRGCVSKLVEILWRRSLSILMWTCSGCEVKAEQLTESQGIRGKTPQQAVLKSLENHISRQRLSVCSSSGWKK
jgi:hypothetical protein